jgi:hypothetical protein
VRAGSLAVTGVSFAAGIATGGSSGDFASSGQGKGGAIFVNTGVSASIDAATTFSNNAAGNAGCGSGSESTDNSDVYGAVGGYIFNDTAAHLAFLNQPGTTTVNTAIAPALQVNVTDGCNNPLSGISVTLSLSSGPAGATFTPITVASGANGIATFNDVSLSVQGPGYVLQASTAGVSPVTTNSFLVYAPLGVCTAAPSGVTAWWKGDGDATDVTGVYNGTIGGDVSFAPGEVAQAFSFDGSSTPYVALPSAAFAFPNPNPFSFEFWFETASSSTQFILGQQEAPPHQAPSVSKLSGIFISGGRLRANMFAQSALLTPNSVDDGNFHHVAVTYDGTTEILYLDGAQAASSAFTEANYGTPPYYYQLGTGVVSSQWFTFNGLIDEPTLYSVALTPNQVLSLFAAGKYGKCDPGISLLPSSLNFTDVGVDQSATLTSVVSNPGNAPLVISAIGTDNGDANFKLLSGNPGDCAAGTPVAPTGSCNVRVSFSPQSLALLTGSINIVDNSVNNGGIHSVPLSGTGVAGYILTTNVSPSAGGAVTVNTAATNGSYAPATPVSITAVPNMGYVFSYWSGPVASVNSATTTVTISASESVTANFVPASDQVAPPAANTTGFGSVPVCPPGRVSAACTGALNLSFQVNAPVTFGTVKVVTQGVASLDFNLGSTNTCTGTLDNGGTCTVSVNFTPLAPGLRMGAVELFDSSSNPLSTVLIEGTGTGPAAAFLPAVQTTLAATGTCGVAVDAAGDLFVSECNQVIEIPAGGGSPKIIAQSPTVQHADGLAVDGAGDVFVADQTLQALIEFPTGGGSPVTIASGLSYPVGVTVNGAGDVFIANSAVNGSPSVLKVPAGGGTPIPIGAGWQGPGGIAVDGTGNVFVADTQIGVVELPAGGTQTTIYAAVNGRSPESVAVDAAGDVLILDEGLGEVIELAGSAQTVLAGSVQGEQIALDALGDVFVAGNGIIELARSQPPSLTFPNTPLDTASSPQSVTVQNIGNAQLRAVTPGVTIGTNFKQVPGAGTPPDCSASFALAAGASCNLSISFAPTAPGAQRSTAALTDNALNAASVTQTIVLSGTAGQYSTNTSVSVLGGLTYGQTVSFQATVSAAATPTGTVAFTADSKPAGSGVALSGGIGTLSNQMLPAGSHTVGASYTPSNAAYLASSGSTPVHIAQATVQVALSTTSVTAASPGARVTLTATLTPQYGGTFSSPVSFYDGSTLLGTGPVSGVTSVLNTSALAAGAHTFHAVYSGDPNFQTGTSAVTTTINLASMQMSVAPTTLTYPGTVGWLVIVKGSAGTPTGSVILYDGTTKLATTPLIVDGATAGLVLPQLNAGVHSLTAVYGGNTTYATAGSAAQNVTVNPEPVSIGLGCGGTSFPYGTSITCKATVAGIQPAQGTLVWTVDGTPQNATLGTSGSASIVLNGLAVSKHTVTASFAAQGNFAAAATQTDTFTISPAVTATTLGAGSTKLSAPGPVNLTATATSTTAGAPSTGKITFYEGNTAIGSGPVSASGVAMLTTSTLQKGTYSFTAIYGATTDFAAATSKAVTVTVE